MRGGRIYAATIALIAGFVIPAAAVDPITEFTRLGHCDQLGPETKHEILGKWYAHGDLYCDFHADGSVLCPTVFQLLALEREGVHRDDPDPARRARKRANTPGRYEIRGDKIVIFDGYGTASLFVVRCRGKYYTPSREEILTPLARSPSSH